MHTNTDAWTAVSVGKLLIATHRLNVQNAKVKIFIKRGKQGLTTDTIILTKERDKINAYK